MSDKKDQINKSIERVLKNKTEVLKDAYTKSLEELVEDLKIYQFELEFQNEELQRIQNELEKSRNSFRYLFDNAPIGYIVINDEYQILSCNNTFRKMMDISDECKKNLDFRKLIYPDDQDRFFHLIRAIARENKSKEDEIRFIKATTELHTRIIGKHSENTHEKNFLLSIIDLTEQKKTADILNRTKGELRTLTDSMTDMIIVSNPEGIITYVSPSCKQFGYNQAEMVGKTLFDFVSKEDLELTSEAYLESMQSKTDRSIEFRTKHKDGSLSWVETSGNLVFDDNQNVVEAVFVVRSISDRKQTELRLIHLEEFLSRTGKLAKVGGWEYDLETKIVYLTEVTRTIYEVDDSMDSISLEKAIGFYEEGKHRDRLREIVNNAINYGERFDEELLIITEKNNKLWVRAQGEAAFKDGKCIRIFGSLQNIHARKSSELQIARSEERFKALFHNNHAVMLLIDPKTEMIADANPAAESFYGWTRDELLQMSIGQINMSSKDEIKKEMELAIKGHKKQFNFKHRLADGKIRDVEVFSGMITSPDENYLYSIVHDVTEKVQLEKDLHESELRYRSIFYDSQDAMLLLDVNTLKITDANPSALKLFGVNSLEDFRHLSPIDLSPEKQDDGRLSTIKSKEMINQAIAGKHTYFEWKHQNLQGEVFYALVLLNNIYIDGAQVLQSTVRDITSTKRAEEELKKYKNRLESLVKILQHQSSDLQEMLDQALDELINLTESKYGYIYFYNEEKEEFILNSWSKDVMESCKVAEPQTIYCLQETGFWGEVVRQRKPLINNSFVASHPLKKGYPEGHVILEKFLSIPVFFNNKIVAVAAVANKEMDYDQSDVLQMSLLMDTVWKTAERLRAEKAFRESEAKFRIFSDTAPIGILILDKNQMITYVSKGFTNIFGYTLEDIPNMEAWMLKAYPEENQRKKVVESWEYSFNEVNISKTAKPPVESPVQSKTGQTIQTEFLLTSNGEHSFVLFTDVSERKLAIDNLRETSAYLENLINYVNAPIIVWDAQLKITRFNKAFEELSGYTSKDVIEKELTILFPPDCLEHTLSLIQPTATGINLKSVEIEILCADGETKIALWNSANIKDREGRIISTIAQGQDITERKAADLKLAKTTEQLKELNVTKDKLFSIIAHDLRNPFMSLLGISEIMADTSMEFNAEESRQLAANMNHSALSAYNLLENLLEWSRLQRNMLTSEPQFLQIRKLVEALVASHREMISNKSLNVEIKIEEKLLARIDERMIDSAFRNLLTNAIKFTPHHGTIQIAGKRKGQRKIEIIFKDSGIGIPTAILPKIFEVDETKSRKGTDGEISSGLGLIICKELIERNNGSIRVESEENKGSTFFVELPSY